MKKLKPKNYTKAKKLICDWSDKKNYWIHYRMLKFHVRHGLVVDKIHGIFSFKQNTWLKKYIFFITQKRNKAENKLEKDFFKLLNIASYGETMENVRNRLILEIFKKDEYKKIIKQQSKLSFNGIHKSYENCDSCLFRKNEVLLEKPIYLGFAVLELIKLHMYETYYDKLQTNFGQENTQLLYVDAFVLSMSTKDINKDLEKLEDIFDFSNSDKNHEIFSNKNKKVVGILKIGTPKNFWNDEFFALRSKMYAFKCGSDSKNKLKGVSKSQSKPIKFEEYYICLIHREYQRDCNNYIFYSINHEMHLQGPKKSTLSVFDDKRCYINETESNAWN